MRGSYIKRSARVSVVVDSRATTLQASTRGGLGRYLSDYFGADDLFSWVWRVFDDLNDTLVTEVLILKQYLHLHYATVRAARPRNEDNVLVLRTVSLPYFPTYLEARNRRVGKVSPLPCYPAPAPQLGP